MGLTDEQISQLIGSLYGLATDKALRESTRALIAPLVERASVSRALKDAALSAPPLGVMPEEVSTLAPEDVAESMGGFVESGSLRINERGAYELMNIPDPSVHEALKHATVILVEAGWTMEQSASILTVFASDGGPDDDNDDNEESA